MRGLHREIVTQALAAVGEQANFSLFPWKRCLDRVASGEIDAVLDASYTKDRNEFFRYPEGASLFDKSSARLSQIDFVVVLRSDTPAPQPITIESIPEPVGVVLGYQAADTLETAGKETRRVVRQEGLFQMLVRGRVASVVALRDSAEYYANKNPGMMVILEPALWSTSHFLAFGRKSAIDDSRVQRIWLAIRKIREDDGAMAKIRDKISLDVTDCIETQNTEADCGS